MRIIPLAAYSVLVLAVSPAHAGYREIWNPPESRPPVHTGQHTPPRPSRIHSTRRPSSSYASRHLIHPTRTVKAAAIAGPLRRDPVAELPDASVTRSRDLPPVLAPDGTILRT
jgi:hypothetical protein